MILITSKFFPNYLQLPFMFESSMVKKGTLSSSRKGSSQTQESSYKQRRPTSCHHISYNTKLQDDYLFLIPIKEGMSKCDKVTGLLCSLCKKAQHLPVFLKVSSLIKRVAPVSTSISSGAWSMKLSW